MALALDQFVRRVADSGLISAADVQAFVAALPEKQQPADGEQLARLLVKHKKLTAYQAQEVYKGAGKGLVLGNYVVLDKLGQGGMGMVLKAEHKRMKRLVALKVLSPAVTKTPEALQRFQREVEAAAKLRHPNIVAADDADEAGGIHFLVMEYVEGTDLSVLVKKVGPLPVEKALSCIVQAARGLEFAHQEGVIHRDIKPANLLLDNKGNVKILDMGLARFEASAAGGGQADLTGTGQIMGTVDYMAPEQAMNTKNADQRADIYSLGISLWYLVTGKAAYDGETLMEKLMAHQTKPIPSLREVCPQVSPALEAVFVKMVAKTPAERYQSMTEVIAELERCRAGDSSSPSLAPQPGEDSRLSDFLKGMDTSRTSVGVATAGPMTTAGVEATVVLQTPQTDTDPQTNQSLAALRESPQAKVAPQVSAAPNASAALTSKGSSNSSRKWLLLAIAAGALGGILLVALGIWVIVRDKEGKEVGRMKVPDGGSATVQNTGDGSKTPPVTPSPAIEAPSALQFDGKSSVEIPNVRWGKLDTFTFEAWIRADKEPASRGYVVDRLNCSSLSSAAGYWQAVVHCRDKQVTYSYARSSAKHDLGQWTHLANVVHDKTITLYVDGKKIASSPLDAEIDPQFGELITLGKSFVCAIRDVRISKTARYTGNFTPSSQLVPDADTLASYNFAERTGDTLFDGSGHKLHGKIVGAKWVRVDGSSVNSLPTSSSIPPSAKSPFDAKQARSYQDAWATYLGTTVETTNSVGQKMILIPPGEFLMGSTDEQVAAALKVADELKSDHGTKDRIQNTERPQHKVVITKPFLMSATEVTIGQFKKFSDTGYVTEAEKAEAAAKAALPTVEAGQPPPKPVQTYINPGYVASDDLPAAFISWNDAKAYCQWLSTQEKTTYRLPTEAEWEYACRAGTTTQYSVGDDYNELPKYGWQNKAGTRPYPVGTLLANNFGLCDMHGNLNEWCGDYYGVKWYSTSPSNDPIGPSVGPNHVVRGGHWSNHPIGCRSAYRNLSPPSYGYNSLGFRCVRVFDAPATNAGVATQPPAVSPPVVPKPTGPIPAVAAAPFDAKQAKAHQDAWARHLGTTVETTNSVGAKMVLIPPGEFLMGSADEQVVAAIKVASENKADSGTVSRIEKAERPQHKVVITKPMLMSATEVTTGQFKRFSATGYVTEAENALAAAKAAPPADPGQPPPKPIPTYLNPGYVVSDDLPAACISWNDAVAYCQWLSKQEKASYRLPTEAEWEYACRAGTTTQYSFGDDMALLDQFGWHLGNAVDRAQPVGTKLPNGFGLFDMHGNLYEWCGDWYDEKWYEKPSKYGSIGPASGAGRVIRGGGWSWVASNCRSAARGYHSPKFCFAYSGFRVVRVLDTPATTAMERPSSESGLAFDGIDDYVDLTSDWKWDGGELTLDAWVQNQPLSTTEPQFLFILDHGDDGAGRRATRIHNETHATDGLPPVTSLIASANYPAPRIFIHPANPMTQRPTHIAAVWKQNEIWCYIDGQRQTATRFTYSVSSRGGPPYMHLGAVLAAADGKPKQFWQGRMHQLRLTAGALYQADFTPVATLTADAKTIALYKFDEGTGTTLRDSSEHRRDGKIFGATWVRPEGTSSSVKPP